MVVRAARAVVGGQTQNQHASPPNNVGPEVPEVPVSPAPQLPISALRSVAYCKTDRMPITKQGGASQRAKATNVVLPWLLPVFLERLRNIT